jgi:hypothetical protein
MLREESERMAAKYFGVIGNRDHIKIQGVKHPFWEFLDEQPDGWLISLAYHRKDVPTDRPRIWDCGAWSYKMLDVPAIGKDKVNPEWVFGQYQQCAMPGDFVIAPDHMIISEDVREVREEINGRWAREFYGLAKDSSLIPMCVIHGDTISARILQVNEMQHIGYKALALGGLAYRASARRDQIITFVQAVSKYLDQSTWLHVLGLSAPGFAQKWSEFGVNSYDGASHFKQAFTAGKYYWVDADGKLLGFPASKERNGKTDLPECGCLACSKLREEGIDTRTYGSNENNMGRAAHNLNQLIKVLKCIQ